MGEFSVMHWLVVLAIVALLFGGKKIPELAKGLGDGIREFKKASSTAKEESTSAISELTQKKEASIPSKS